MLTVIGACRSRENSYTVAIQHNVWARNRPLQNETMDILKKLWIEKIDTVNQTGEIYWENFIYQEERILVTREGEERYLSQYSHKRDTLVDYQMCTSLESTADSWTVSK